VSPDCTCGVYRKTAEETSHFATYPPKLIEPCILAGSAPGDTVLDPFTGSGTTGAVAAKHGRRFIGCELNPEYIALAAKRIGAEANHLFAGVDA
jgi:site-specific DNA-methyltransferase (adenine-specific)